MRQIFEAKGFTGSGLQSAVEIVTADRERWTRFMLSEEYGLPSQLRSPMIAALSTFAAFVVCGLMPRDPPRSVSGGRSAIAVRRLCPDENRGRARFSPPPPA